MLIWRRDIGQRQTNAETMLCTSTMKFTTLTKVESTYYFSIDINNVGQHRNNIVISNVEFRNVD